jgi:hypothetical protein
MKVTPRAASHRLRVPRAARELENWKSQLPLASRLLPDLSAFSLNYLILI